MADTKISALTALTGANVDQLADVMPIVDTGVATTKKILVSELAQSMMVLGTEQATTAGTAITVGSIPAWVKRITINFKGVSTNGTSNLLIQIGDAGGIETSTYTSGVSNINGIVASTAGFIITFSITASDALHGRVVLELENAGAFSWVCTSQLYSTDGGGQIQFGAGSKSTSAALTQFSLTTVNGTDTFDAGAFNTIME